jgi:hypothetical protein
MKVLLEALGVILEAARVLNRDLWAKKIACEGRESVCKAVRVHVKSIRMLVDA